MKKTFAWLLSAALIFAACTSAALATGDDITGSWGDVSKITVAITTEGSAATATVSGADEAVEDIVIVIAAYGAGNKLLAVKTESGAATACKTASIAQVPDGATLLKAFVLGRTETGEGVKIIPLIPCANKEYQADQGDPNQGTWIP
ncbi:MAG: hypothetical protein IJS65_05055 [Clostridia bacterium]|nr:hypothetical protein [Clostridia bacterium]